MQRQTTKVLSRGVGLALLVCALFLPYTQSRATANVPVQLNKAWTSLGPTGGAVHALTVDPQDATSAYALAGSELYRSSGGGNSWTRIETGAFSAGTIAISAADNDTIYLGARFSSGMIKSTDRGASWAPITQGLEDGNVLALLVSPSDAALLYAATEGGIFKTADGGASWRTANGGLGSLDVYALAFDPSTESTLYAGTDEGLFRTDDGGMSWQKLQNGDDSLSFIRSILIDPADVDIIYAAGIGGFSKSSDRGETWFSAEGSIGGAFVTSLTLDTQNGQVLYAGTQEDGLLKSVDGGLEWQQADSGIPVNQVDQVVILGDAQGTLLAATSRDLFRSSDDAATWTPSGSGIDETVVQTLLLRQISGNQTGLMLGSSGGILRTTSSLENWESANAGLRDQFVLDLASSGSASDTLFAATSGGADLYKSLDGGETWFEIDLPGFSSADVTAIAPGDPNRVYAALFGAIAVSTDGGENWTSSSQGLDEFASFSRIVVDPTNADIAYAVDFFSGVFKTVDGGESWNAINGGLEDVRVNDILLMPDAPETLFLAATGAAIYRSVDSGSTWAASNIGFASAEARRIIMLPGEPAILVAASRDGIFRSTDGGASWDVMNLGLEEVGNAFCFAYDSASDTLYAGTAQGVFMWTTASQFVDFSGNRVYLPFVLIP